MREALTHRLFRLVFALALILTLTGIQPTRAEASAFDDTQTEVMDGIFDFCITELGLNNAGAVGIISNIYTECKFNPTAGRSAYGICQWTGSRKSKLKSWTAEHGYDHTTLEGQLYYLKQELQHKDYQSMLKSMKELPNTAQGAYDAASIWCAKFERPANSNQKFKRGENAKTMFWPLYAEKEAKGVNKITATAINIPIETAPAEGTLKAPFLSTEVLEDGVKLTWISSPGAKGYRVYRREEKGSWVQIADTSAGVRSMTYTIAGDNSSYEYTVEAYADDKCSTFPEAA